MPGIALSDDPVPPSGAGGGASCAEEPASDDEVAAPELLSEARSSEAHERERSASLPLASDVASPARRASGAALSAVSAANSAARAENSRTVGVARSARSSIASRMESRIAVAVDAPLDDPVEPGWPVPVSASPVQLKLSSGFGCWGVLGSNGSVMVSCSSMGLVLYIVARTAVPSICRWSRCPTTMPYRSDSGSTSTDHGASTAPSRRATGSTPRSTTFHRQRSARLALYAGAGPTTLTTACAPDRLDQQLIRALRGAFIGEVERDVRRDDANQRHGRDVEALGDQARPHEDVGPASTECVDDAFGGATMLDDVTVETCDAKGRERLADL